VVEDCVNAVGVDVNTASAPLLARVSGLSSRSRKASSPTATRTHVRIARRAEGRGRVWATRPSCRPPASCASWAETIRSTPRRCNPESYPLVKKNPRRHQEEHQGSDRRLQPVEVAQPGKYADEQFGVPTISDILLELKSRAAIRVPNSPPPRSGGVEELKDLKPDMILRAWSPTSRRSARSSTSACIRTGWCIFRRCPTPSSKTAQRGQGGQVVRVKVLEVDEKRKRIALTMR